MMGCRTDGEFHIVDLQLSGSLFADLAGRFRTRIGGDFNASGAEIKGDLTIDGAQIGGRFVFITGRLGRLRANVDAWSVFDPSSGRLAAHFCASETQGIVLQAVAIDENLPGGFIAVSFNRALKFRVPGAQCLRHAMYFFRTPSVGRLRCER